MIEKGGYIRDLLAGMVGQTVNAYGWVKTRRDSKGIHFVQITTAAVSPISRWSSRWVRFPEET